MAKFCGKCGSKLDEKTGLCPQCGRPPSPNLPTQSNHQNNATSSQKTTTRKGAKPYRKLIITIICLVVLAFGTLGGLVVTDTIQIPIIDHFLLRFSDTAKYTDLLESVLSGEDDVSFVDENGISIDTLSSGETAQKIMSLISFTIDGIQNEEDHTIAFVQFSVPDMIALSTEYVDNNNLDTDFLSWVRDRLKEDYPTAEIDAQIRFINNNGEFSLVVDKELSNVLTGGALSYYLENEKAAYESLKGELEE